MGWTALGLIALALGLGAAAISVGGNARSSTEANQAAALGFSSILCLLTTGWG